MKVKNKFLTSLLLLLVATSAMSNGHANYNGQGEWYSDSSVPAVRVFVQNSYVYAEQNNRNQNLPAIQLKRVNGVLLNEFAGQYILIQDFTHDKYADIGVLKSVSYGGSNRCYAVFAYSPKFYSFKSRASKTVCID